MNKNITTPLGEVQLVSPPAEVLLAIQRFMPLGAVGYKKSEDGPEYGIVMRCGEKEAYAVKQQPPDSDEQQAKLSYKANRLLIAHSLGRYLQSSFSGLLMPCPYLRGKEGGAHESGIAYFGCPSPAGPEALDRPFDSVFDNQFGHGFTAMMMASTEAIKESSKVTGITRCPLIGLDVRPRSALGTIGMELMVIRQDVICLKAHVSAEDPLWTVLADVGIKRLFHLPSVPATIQAEDMEVAKPSDLDYRDLEVGMPARLRPVRGCRLLVKEVTDSVYEMPVRAIAPETLAQISGQTKASDMYKLVKSLPLSPDQSVACLQRVVMLEPDNAGWWYTLGCHYELEGKDWYGAANAFNHAIFFDKQHAASWFSLGQLWAKRGIMSKAQEFNAEFERISTATDRP